MTKAQRDWIKPGARVKDVRYGSKGTVIATLPGVFVAWDREQTAPGGQLHVARRVPAKYLEPARELGLACPGCGAAMSHPNTSASTNLCARCLFGRPKK